MLRAEIAEQIPENMVRIELPAWKCERCEHVWVPRSMDVEPRVCPKCKSPYWNRQRRTSKSAEAK